MANAIFLCVSNKCSNYSESKDNFLVLGKGPFEKSNCYLSICYDYANSYPVSNEEDIWNHKVHKCIIQLLI